MNGSAVLLSWLWVDSISDATFNHAMYGALSLVGIGILFLIVNGIRQRYRRS